MGIVNEGVAFGAFYLSKARRGGCHRLLLNVEGVHAAALAHRAAEKFGIVSVAHGEVHGNIALPKMGQDQLFLKIKQTKHILTFLL